MNKTRYYVMALVGVVLLVMNIAIWQKEQILSDGEVVYVKLAPVDPRSLMQGDYMRLRYAIDEEIPRYDKTEKNHLKYTNVVITINSKNIAEFVRLDDGSTALADKEKRLKLNHERFRRGIKPNSFFFQEGHAKLYEAAEYGIFTFAKGHSDSYLLTGLADKDLREIVPIIE